MPRLHLLDLYCLYLFVASLLVDRVPTAAAAKHLLQDEGMKDSMSEF